MRRKLTLRILPFVTLLFVLSFLDRVNLSYAALDMNRDLKFSPETYGLGAGIFFLGYFLFEIPAAMLVEEYGARRWLGRMLIGWGAAATLMGTIHGVASFHTLRVLLGIAEAGFFPGIILYLGYWFPNAYRGRAIGALAVGLPAANLLGAPLSSWILSSRWLDIPGWRWLFILEGLPSVLMGIVTMVYLVDRPGSANWLTKEEKESLAAALASEQADAQNSSHPQTIKSVDRRLAILALIWFLDNMGVYGFNLWLPSIIHRASGFSSVTVAAISSLPFVGAFCAAAIVSLTSDRTRERRWHTAGPMMVFGLGLCMSVVLSRNWWVSLAWLSVGALGLTAGTPGFWALATATPARSPSRRIAIITSAGALGGFCGPYLIGYLRSTTQSFNSGLLALALAVVGAGALTIGLRNPGSK